MLLSSINNKRNNHRYSIQQESKRKKDFRKSRNKQQLNKNNNDLASKSSRSSSLHSLVSTTTFLNRKSIWKLNKMIATTASPNSNQFNNHHHNSNKTFNSFKNNNNNNSSSINSSSRRSNDFNKKNANINNRFQQKKSNPIQINRNNFAQQQQQPNFNLNMFQNSELTVNLTNNEPRLVIFNNNPSSQSFNLPNNSNKLINYFNNNKFKPQSQQQHQFQRQLSNSATTNSANLEASNCNFYNKNSIDSYNYKNKNIAAFQGFKQNMTPTNIGTQQQQQQQRYSSNRFKYIKSISHSATKNSAPYNTTQYIMFDYSRRRRDEEYPNEQKSFSDEWNMHLAAANKETNNNPIEINDNNASILSVNYNHFSLNNSSKQDNKPEHLGNRQLSLSEHNLETMDQDEAEQMQVVNTLNETLPSPSITATTTLHHMSSSL